MMHELILKHYSEGMLSLTLHRFILVAMDASRHGYRLDCFKDLLLLRRSLPVKSDGEGDRK